MSAKVKINTAILVFLCVIGGLFFFGKNGFSILSGLRAYVGGEGLWAKGQKEATYQLAQYIFTKEKTRYQAFLDSLKAPLGDRVARIELEKSPPVYEIIFQGFVEGGNDPEDIPTMISLYKNFKDSEYISKAIEHWEIGDGLIKELLRIGEEIHRHITNNNMSKEQAALSLAEIDELQKRLNKAETQFAYNMTEAARRTAKLFFFIMLIFSVTGSIVCFIMLRMISGIISDLNDKNVQLVNQANRERVIRNELKENEERLKRTQQIARLGSWELDVIKNELWWSDQTYRIYGFTIGDKTALERFRESIHPQDRQHVMELIGQAIKQGIPLNLDYRIILPDGDVRYLHEESSTISSGTPDGVIKRIGSVQDITDRKQSDAEKKELQARLQRSEKMEALGTLAGGVAHDLNNVLGGLVSYPDLILMDLPNDSHLREPILTIQDSGKKAAAIVQDLLTLARRGVAVSEVVNLNGIVNSYLTSPEYEKLKTFFPKAQLKTDPQGDLLNVLGSPVHLSKTVMNLVSNAVESLHDAGIVTISTRNQYIDTPIKGYDEVREGDYVVLTVADNGVGIANEDLKKIFEPFYTKKVMGRSGTGLGMSVVWGTVKDHNGYINVESIEGKGSNFSLYFPITRKAASKDQPSSVEEYTGKGEKILVVDDVPQQREIASVLLKKLGYSVDVASSGEEAVEYMKKKSADLLILDMIMDPGIDGLDTYKKILELHPKQKAIIASGFSETERVKTAQKLGAGQYVKKPYTLEKIGLAVKAELSR